MKPDWPRFSFEIWAESRRYSVERYHDESPSDPFDMKSGTYVDPKIQTAWECFQYFKETQ